MTNHHLTFSCNTSRKGSRVPRPLPVLNWKCLDSFTQFQTAYLLQTEHIISTSAQSIREYKRSLSFSEEALQSRGLSHHPHFSLSSGGHAWNSFTLSQQLCFLTLIILGFLHYIFPEVQYLKLESLPNGCKSKALPKQPICVSSLMLRKEAA